MWGLSNTIYIQHVLRTSLKGKSLVHNNSLLPDASTCIPSLLLLCVMCDVQTNLSSLGLIYGVSVIWCYMLCALLTNTSLSVVLKVTMQLC